MDKIAQVANVLAKMGVVRYARMNTPSNGNIGNETNGCIDSWFLECNFLGKKFSYLIQVDDWNFLTLPKVYLRLPLNSVFSKLMSSAHFGPVFFELKGVNYLPVCYSPEDSREFPRSSARHVLEWVMTQTNAIINRTVNDSLYQEKEILREIEPLWTTLSMENIRLSNSSERFYSGVNLYMDSIPEKTLGVKFRGWSIPYFENSNIVDHLTYSLKTNSNKYSALFSLFNWIQKQRKSITGLQFFLFLKSVDKELVNKFRFYLEFLWKDIIDKKMVSFVLIVQDKFFLPFSLTAKEIPSTCIDHEKILKEVDGKTAPNLINKLQIHPQRAHNLTPEYIFRRNIEDLMSKNLAGLNIVLIGCGAIGGHLAMAIARLGGGSQGGELALIDPDLLGAQNLGRHVLGKNYIEKGKSKSVKEEIDRQFDNLNISWWDQSALSYDNDFYNKYQLIIDATGKIELSEALNERYQNGDMPSGVLLHVWIRANGEAVQAILVKKGDGYACRSCLQETGYYFIDEHDALPQLKPKSGLTACQSFTPYSVAASMSSAALAIDMCLGWVNDQNIPRYQTRYTEAWNGRKLNSINAPRRNDCSICSNSYHSE